MIHEKDGIAVGDQVVHDAVQTHDVGRVQPDGRLIQHVEYAGRAVAHGSRELHPLPFPGGERGSRSVQRQVGKSQIHETAGSVPVRFADAFCHRLHLVRHRVRHAGDPVDGFGESHGTGLSQGNPHQPRCPGFLRKPCPAAVRTYGKPQKFLHALHALFVFYFREGILDGIDCVEKGEIHLAGRTAGLILVNHVMFDWRAVEDNLALLFRQLSERHVCPDAELSGDVLHQ